MHDPDGVIHELASADQDGRFAVGAAADGEDGIGRGLAAVEGDDGVEAESCGCLAKWNGWREI